LAISLSLKDRNCDKWTNRNVLSILLKHTGNPKCPAEWNAQRSLLDLAGTFIRHFPRILSRLPNRRCFPYCHSNTYIGLIFQTTSTTEPCDESREIYDAIPFVSLGQQVSVFAKKFRKNMQIQTSDIESSALLACWGQRMISRHLDRLGRGRILGGVDREDESACADS
jgi:hypothetical protein